MKDNLISYVESESDGVGPDLKSGRRIYHAHCSLEIETDRRPRRRIIRLKIRPDIRQVRAEMHGSSPQRYEDGQLDRQGEARPCEELISVGSHFLSNDCAAGVQKLASKRFTLEVLCALELELNVGYY